MQTSESSATENTELQDLRIVVSSCDLYCDMWPLYFHFLDKYWKDAPTPIYLISNHLSYDDPRVVTVKVGDDKSWTDGIARAMPEIPAEYVLFMLDDFMLTEAPDFERLARVATELKDNGGDWVCLRPKAEPPEDTPDALISPLTDAAQSAGFHAGIWRTQYLQKLCANVHLNIWHTEGHIRKVIRSGAAGNLFYLTHNGTGILSYIEVVKRFWRKEGMDFVTQEGVKPDLNRRPFPPQGDNVFSRFVRSILKRYVRYMAVRQKQDAIKNHGGKISATVELIK